LPTIY